MFSYLECAAVHAPESSFPMAIRNKLSKVAQGDSEAQLQLAQDLDNNMRYYFRTSQSVAKVNGGVKVNAIPESASTMVNLRLAVETSIPKLKNTMRT